VEFRAPLWLNRLMTATLILRKQTHAVKHGMTIRKALQKLNIEPDSVLITRNGELLTDDEIIRENDVIKLVPVISGG
jgi:sulfur carrier protein ThiS